MNGRKSVILWGTLTITFFNQIKIETLNKCNNQYKNALGIPKLCIYIYNLHIFYNTKQKEKIIKHFLD